MACLVLNRSPMKESMANRCKPFVMEIPCDGDQESASKKASNLQEAFEKFRKSRQREMKVVQLMEEKALHSRQDIAKMEALRNKFMDGIKKYFGIPYAKRYHEPGSPYHDSPMFLDCCGLIRRVLLDLKEDFGFGVGPGNQAYMYDTLPNDIEREEDMKPGDLVFITATYYTNTGKKLKKQKHDMVHVEVWAGDGEKTIGARWQKGVVQVFDSYKFVSKSYHSMKYHFKSIDTWLMGICKSFCPEHTWRKSAYNPGKKSIFALDNGEEDEPCEAAEEQQEEGDDQLVGEGRGVKEEAPTEEVKAPGHMPSSHISAREPESVDVDKDVVLHQDLNDVCLENRINETRENSTANALCSEVKSNIKKCANKLSIENTENSSNNNDIGHSDEISESHGLQCKEEASLVLRSVYENVESNFLQIVNCQCPECLPFLEDCPHSRTFNHDNEEEESPGRLSDCSELSSSLECFEVIGSPEYTGEVDHAIVSCPIERSSKDGGSGSTSPTKEKSSSRGSGGSPPSDGNGKKDGKENAPRPRREGAKSRMSTLSRQPTFYVSNGNGRSMVDSTLVSLGWRRLEDKNDDSFKMKWVECKSQLDYKNFREGEQLVNHISNIGLLTTKVGLLSSLQEYERVLDKVGARQRVTLSDFVPETYSLSNLTEKQRFIDDIYKEGEIWICKPIGQNQGKGIYMVNSTEQLREKLKLNGEQQETRRVSHVRPPQGRVIQRYITNPLLLNGFKFDVRTYMFIASTRPYIVLYHPGYIRVSCVPYSPYSQENTSELHAHLTNQYIQKKHPLYEGMKEETVWSFDRIQAYIDEHHAKEKQLADNWMFTTFTKRMQQIMLTCFHSVRKKLHRRQGYFDLLGFDFMIDENFKVWLIEINVNPSLSTSCQVLKDFMPGLVDHTIKIALEVFEKTKKKKPIFPLENMGDDYQVLYNGEGKG